MAITRLPSSYSSLLPQYFATTPSNVESKKFSGTAEESVKPAIDELLNLIQEFVKQFAQDGFEGAGQKPAPVGGASNGRCGGGGGGGGGGELPFSLEGEQTPPELGFQQPGSPQTPFSGSGNGDAVAEEIAQDAVSWNYDRSPGKSFDDAVANENNFDASKSGICTDMALEAAQRFEAEGIDARVVGGKTDKGNHAWVEYKGADGQWKAFDPTAAATTKDAQTALDPYNGNTYQYGETIGIYEEIPAI